MSDSKLAYRADVDGLRAVAVLSVVFCHAGMWLPGGFVGVDVFFVISGFLIAGLILKELQQGAFSLTNFWERRVRRIVPAMTVVVAATLLAAFFILMPEDFASFGKSMVGLALLASNVQFWRDINYFDDAADEKPLLHTWSLSVEEQFYLFVPVLLFLLARRAKLNRAFWVLAGLAVASFALSVDWTHRHPKTNFYLLPTRAWELFAGALLAFAPTAILKARKCVTEVVGFLGLAMIVVPCFLYTEKTPFPGLAALPPVAGAVLLIWSGAASHGLPLVGRILAWRPVVFVGLISYSLYLWHWPLFSLTRYALAKEPAVWGWWLLIAGSVALAVLSWRYVETPFRQRRVFVSRPRLFTVTALVFLGMIGIGGGLFAGKGFGSRVDAVTKNLIETGRFDQSYVHELEPEQIPDEMVRLGTTNAVPTALVWGDSHSMAILPLIDAIGKELGISAVAATHAATPPVIGYFARTEWGLNERALPFNAAVLQYVKTSRIPAVILVSFWNMHAEKPDFQAALLKTVTEIRAVGTEVYIMRDIPIFDYNVQKWLVRASYKTRDLSQLEAKLGEIPVTDKLPEDLVKKLTTAGVQWIDPVPTLQKRSKSQQFLPFDEGGSFYYDGNHLSTYGSMALKPLFLPIFEKFGGSNEARNSLSEAGPRP